MLYNKLPRCLFPPKKSPITTAINGMDVMCTSQFAFSQTNLQTKHTQPDSQPSKRLKYGIAALDSRSHPTQGGLDPDGMGDNQSRLPDIGFPAIFDRTPIVFDGTDIKAGMSPIKKRGREGSQRRRLYLETATSRLLCAGSTRFSI